MRCARTSTYVLALACSLASSSLGCSVDKSPAPDGRQRPEEDAGSDAEVVDPGMDGGMPPASLLAGVAASRVGNLTFDQAVTRVELAGEHVIALHKDSSASIVDLSDPRAPKIAGVLVTADRVVALRYDHVRQVVFLLTASGELRALRITDPSTPAAIGAMQLPIPDGEDDDRAFQDLARIGDRLFALASSHIVPIDVAWSDDGDAALSPLRAVIIDPGAVHIAESGTGLYVAFGGGVIRSFSGGKEPASVDETDLGAEILGWSVRGQRLWIALEDVGVRALWLRPGEALDIELRAGELSDVKLLARDGQVLAAALDRGRIALLDVSITDQPRGIAVHEAGVPDWIAVAGGNLLVGSASELQVIGVPPIVESGMPASAQEAAPRHGRLELRFSKPLDPETITLESVVLRCDGRLVPMIPHLDLDGSRVAVLPTTEVAANSACEIRLRGVQDALGLKATSSSSWLTFTANDGLEGFVHNGPSAEPHTAEGRMTGWTRNATGGFEYADIAPAAGVGGDLYVDFDGERMWLFFDALDQRDMLYADCAAVFSGFVGSGLTRFTASVAGDQTVEADGVEAVGGYAYGATQGSREPHATFELALETGMGGFAVQMYMPSTSRGCEHNEREPVVFSGMCDATGCTVDGRGAVDLPATPSQLAPAETSDPSPTIRFNVSNGLMSLPEGRVEIALPGETPRVLFRGTTYGNTLPVPAGVLAVGQYELRVTASNIAGFSPPATRTLAVIAQP